MIVLLQDEKQTNQAKRFYCEVIALKGQREKHKYFVEYCLSLMLTRESGGFTTPNQKLGSNHVL